MNVKKYLLREIQTINSVFQDHDIEAQTSAKQTIIAGDVFVSYGINCKRGVKLSKIESLLPELSEAITTLRRRPCPVRAQYMPFALEVEHPYPQPLKLDVLPQLQPHEMLLGRSFNMIEGACDQVCSFEKFPHSLIAGTTGAGKSTLLAMMMLSLCYYTSPDDLKLVLIDLKNEDLVPFIDIPHCITFASDLGQAKQALHYCFDELQKRISEKSKPYRLVVVVDELAELSTEKDMLTTLGRYLGRGRSKWCNGILATQYPTRDVLGPLGKANIPHRMGGICVDSRTAELVAARPKSFLHMLPGKGSFMRIHGSTMERIQTYYLDENYQYQIIEDIKNKWFKPSGVKSFSSNVSPEVESVLPYLPYGNTPPSTPPSAPPSTPFIVPNNVSTRELSDMECVAIHMALSNNEFTRNGMQKHLYGNTGTTYRKRLNVAVERARILLDMEASNG